MKRDFRSRGEVLRGARLLVIILSPFVLGRAFALPIGDVRALYDWSDLPLLGTPEVVEHTNTRGAEAGKLKDASPGQCVLLDEKGPGCIVRFSVFSNRGVLKVNLDGAATPQIDVPLEKLYLYFAYYSVPERREGLDKEVPQVFPFLYPLSHLAAGYKNSCYIPVPFSKSARVVFEHDVNNPWVPYSLLVMHYPEGTSVDSYNPERIKGREVEVRTAARAWRSPGLPPTAYGDERKQTGTLAVPPKSTIDLWKDNGSGTLVGLRLRTQPWHRAIDRLLVLRAYWDGGGKPSLESPIGDFCASHGGVRQPLALPVGGGNSEGWYWCYLPMPFSRGARLTLENLSVHRIPILQYEIMVRPGPVPSTAGRLCARWKRLRQLGTDGLYEMLHTTGPGKLVGYNFYASGYSVPVQFGLRKSRMSLYRDEETEAGFAGLSLMMYYYNGWYGGPNWDSPLSAVPELEYQKAGVYADYRFFITDAVEWSRSARLIFDTSKDEFAGRDFSSVTYLYRSGVSADSSESLKREDLLLPMARYSNSVEAEDLVTTAEVSKGSLLVVDDSDERYAVGGNRFVTFAPFGVNDSIAFHVPVTTAGSYTLRARLVCSPSGGFWKASVNGTPVDAKGPAFDCYTEETSNNVDKWANLGQHSLHAGDNTILFTSRPPYVGFLQRGSLLGIDGFTLEPVNERR